MSLDQRIEELEDAAERAADTASSGGMRQTPIRSAALLVTAAVLDAGCVVARAVREDRRRVSSSCDACVCGHTRSDHVHERGPCTPVVRCGSGCQRFTLSVEREAVDSTRVDALKEIVQEWGYGRMTDNDAMQRVAEEVDG